MLIGDNVLRGRYGLTRRWHNGIKEEFIIMCVLGGSESNPEGRRPLAAQHNGRQWRLNICAERQKQAQRHEKGHAHVCASGGGRCWQKLRWERVPGRRVGRWRIGCRVGGGVHGLAAAAWHWLEGLGQTKPARPHFSREKNPNSFSSADLYGAAAAAGHEGDGGWKSSVTWECILAFRLISRLFLSWRNLNLEAAGGRVADVSHATRRLRR